MNLAQHLYRSTRIHGEKPAVALAERVVLNYAQLGDRVARLARSLLERLGLRPGDRVALVLRNEPHYVELLYACWHAGLAVVPVNAKLHPAEFAYILDHSGSRVCFASTSLMEAVLSCHPKCAGLGKTIAAGGAEYEALFQAEPLKIQPVGRDDLAWLFYTSGTTGQPKGAMLTHGNLNAMSLAFFANVDQAGPGDCILHAAPMSHGSGIYILPQVMAGACQVVPASGGFEPAEVFHLLQHWSGLCLFAAPTMVKRLIDQYDGSPTGGLKTIVYGGGPMYVEDALAALELFGAKLVQIFGQGESPMTITALGRSIIADRGHPRWMQRLASVGTAHSVVEIQVADPDDQPLPGGEVGEILVRGDTVMKGYWQNPAASAETLRGGWLHTGDMGVLDEDGFLTLKDRSKDLIISGGTNIYPREVEEVLLTHPRVSEVSVIGRPDPEWGENVIAFVVPKTGLGLDSKALDQHCLERMARFKRPKGYHFVASLPKNNYGKVLKTELRQQDSLLLSNQPLSDKPD